MAKNAVAWLVDAAIHGHLPHFYEETREGVKMLPQRFYFDVFGLDVLL